MAASTNVQADTYDYNYSSTFQGANFSGTFQATITGVGSNLSASGTIPISNATGFYFTDLQITSINGALSFNNGIGSFNSTIYFPNTAHAYADASGPVSGSSSAFSFGDAGLGLFSAVDAGPSSGGGGGGSGGAPSPEVNAGLGVLLAGGTFIFLKRKRGGLHQATAA
ncbi:MAG: hypothetical protein INR71_13670 [Terriglobus roseus]|nr:hypothetical protein [Terriglobus roseus]